MKNSITFILLTWMSLTTQTALAACSVELDMGGNSIINATMTGIEEQSPVVTTQYVKTFLSSGNNGFTVSHEYAKPASSWYDAMAYCEALESRERGRRKTGPVYTDWRLPSVSEAFTICHNGGTYIKFHKGESELVELNGQENQLGTAVLDPKKSDARFFVSGDDFCRDPLEHTLATEDRGIKRGQDFGMLVRNIYYTYDGFDSKFFKQNQDQRGLDSLTTNYSVVSSYNPSRTHIIKSPLPISPEINTEHSLHVLCVR